ncbi:MAG TPA: glycine zipper 2TM domain-containing protein [Moraxellaceae bacterium]
MDNTSSPRMHPLMVAAAISIILFCGVGIAAVTGLLPLTKKPAESTETTPAQPDPLAATPAVPAAEEKKAEAPVAHKIVHHERVAERPAPVAAAPVCYNCGTVVAVTPVKVQGQASGVGAVGGAVLGGVLGHQFGKGHGKQAMTAVGAIGGAFGGNEVEKATRSSTRYDVTVRMEDGSSRTVSYGVAPGVNSGDRVRVDGDSLVPY